MPDFKTIRIEGEPGSRGHAEKYPELKSDLRESIITHFNENRSTFNGLLGMMLRDVREGYSRMEIENTERTCQPAMMMHGGASFGLADSAVAMALVGRYGFNKLLLTIEMKINYLEPIPMGLVTAEAFVIRASRTSAYAEVDIWANGRLAARATSTYMIRPRAQRP